MRARLYKGRTRATREETRHEVAMVGADEGDDGDERLGSGERITRENAEVVGRNKKRW